MTTASRVILQAGEVKVDSDPGVLAALFHNLVHNKEYRAAFEKDPAAFLAECGIEVPQEIAKRVTSQNIDAALAQLSEDGSGRAVALIVAPGVAPAIRVGTRPGTRPGVNAGVRVATGTSTFAVADPQSTEKASFEELVRK